MLCTPGSATTGMCWLSQTTAHVLAWFRHLLQRNTAFKGSLLYMPPNRTQQQLRWCFRPSRYHNELLKPSQGGCSNPALGHTSCTSALVVAGGTSSAQEGHRTLLMPLCSNSSTSQQEAAAQQHYACSLSRCDKCNWRTLSVARNPQPLVPFVCNS